MKNKKVPLPVVRIPKAAEEELGSMSFAVQFITSFESCQMEG